MSLCIDMNEPRSLSLIASPDQLAYNAARGKQFKQIKEMVKSYHFATLSLFQWCFFLFVAIPSPCAATKPLKPTKLVDAVCRKTNSSYSFCVESLYSDPRTPTADSYVLAYISFGLAYLNASATQHHVARLLNNKTQRGHQLQQLGTCHRDYNKAVSALQLAYNDLNSETFSELADLAGVASLAAEDCQAAFNTTFSPLTNMNRDLKDLCKICVVEPNDLNSNSIEAGPDLSCSYTYSCNCELTKLGRCGKVKDARHLFDDMPQPDAVSYASMINVYLKNHDLPSAERLFQAMPTSNIVAESAMISGYAKAGRIGDARQVFDRMENRNVYSWTSLISGYFSCGQVDEARRLFGHMPIKNVVSWTTMILGYARNNMVDEARHVFNLMPERNTVSWTVMIKALIDNDQFDEALSLFNDMPQRNLYSWNIIILGLLIANRTSEAIKLFDSMPCRNAISWTTMVTGLAHNNMTQLAREYFDRMPNKDVAAWNAMIAAYVDQGLVAEAAELFSLMHERNVVTWNLMIDGYTKSGSKEEALKHLILMLRFCFRPNGTTMASVLSSCEGMMELMQSHALVLLHGFEHDTVVVNTLVTMYSRNGDVTSARFVFDHLREKDMASWNAMVSAYSNHGYGHHALQVFAHMLRSGTKPDEITFVGVLSACSHAGLVNKGQRVFNSMNHVYDIEPKAQHYSCLVDILGRAGLVDEATKVVRMMPASEKDAAVLGALLGAYRLHGDIRMASLIGEALQELEPDSAGGYVLLATIYAARGKWDEFARVRKKMKERKVNKVPGFSQIQVKGRSHVFYARDRSHPQAAEIWGLLQDKLLPHMWEMRYSKYRSPEQELN